ncbi:M23 family metallopeptidase [Erythrobacter litoralis]|uniref:Membrane protein n=1 Tax=Erythrobacter litoralis (strain HTCC2594) TaxID=314225 RepID=Q2N6Y3_ERYLH|nr:M23 family metallopeptidase [Erythrobacter litoralis]ABC64558.1 membrane protein [Erythrobacter litoralis HTCC2594]
MISFLKATAKTGALIAASLTVGIVSPASANTSASAASVEVTKPVKESASPLGKGDDQFRELFAQWEGLDKGTGSSTTKTRSSGVSIPSRMPLEGASLTSGYGMRTHPVLGGRRSHKGVDLAAPTGTPVYATGDGLVEMAQWFSSYGKYIQIGHGNDLETRFAHLSRIVVDKGEFVQKGDLIGYVGSTGRSTGPHLHYEVRVGGVAVNPIPYMVESDTQIAFAEATGRGAVGGD